MKKGFTPTPIVKKQEKVNWSWGNKVESKLVWGFTLIEIMLVLAIVAVLTALTIPHINRTRLITKQSFVKHELRVINTAIVYYFYEHKKFPTSIEELRPYLEGIPDLESEYKLNPIFGQE